MVHVHPFRRELNRAAIERLMGDLRVLSPLGIERAAMGWDQHGAPGLPAYHAAEQAALHASEEAGLGQEWDDIRRSLFEMTETRRALIAWKTEHGETGHKAERAVFGAALGLFIQGQVRQPQYTTLVRPLAEALPWLLPETASSEPG